MLEAAKTGPVTLEVASCARPAPLLNHRPLPPQKPSSSRRGERSPSRGRIGKAETAWAQIEAATWPVYARAQLQGVMRARCPCPAAGGRRRCRTHIYSGSPNCSSRVAAAATHRRRDGASGGVATPRIAGVFHPPPSVLPVPLRLSLPVPALLSALAAALVLLRRRLIAGGATGPLSCSPYVPNCPKWRLARSRAPRAVPERSPASHRPPVSWAMPDNRWLGGGGK